MNMLSRPHPAQVPTLTEVIEVGGEVELAPATPIPEASPAAQPASPGQQAMAPDSGSDGGAGVGPVQESQLVQRVLTDVQRQIDSMLEFRLREALAPVLARHSEAIVRDLKEDLARTMRDVVARSVAQEVAKLRQR